MKNSKINFSVYNTEQYKRIIASPSQSQAYFERFHKPIIESLILKFGPPVKLIDVACGFAHELEFLKNDSRVRLTGMDISQKMLVEAKKSIPHGVFKQADVAKARPPSNSFHGAILVNAMIYANCVENMGMYAYSSLVDGGMAAINFRDARNPSNIPFFEDCIRCGCKDIIVPLEVNGMHFKLRVMDYTQRKDINRNLGQQAYFQSRHDMEGFLSLIGFSLVSHGTYTYESSENKNNVADVYTLSKMQNK